MANHLSLPRGIDPRAPARVSVGQHEPDTYDHIPRDLRKLLRGYTGRPGCRYAQVCVLNMKRAEMSGWEEVKRPTYTIVGPEGQVDVKLYRKGKMIPGQPASSGRRVLLCDKLIEETTGHKIKREESVDGEESRTEADSQDPPSPQEVRAGDAGVQGGDTQKQQRTEGDQAESGQGNRGQRSPRSGAETKKEG